MRNRSKKGFTLIELLIVIAIIGILAAVLIPQLLRARNVAVDRAAQAYVQNVYTAANAYMAENINQTATQTAAIDALCGDGVAYGAYGIGAPSFTTTLCSVAANAAGTDFLIQMTYAGGVLGTTTITFP